MARLFICLLGFIPLFAGSRVEIPVAFIQSHFHNLTEADILTLCIGAPEIVRFSETQNLIETEILELTYVNHGSSSIDFSIGPFQMKPSFIERLEQEIKIRCELSHFRWLTVFPECESRSVRETRLKRISDPNFILGYLMAFETYCTLSYQLDQVSKEERLKFMASAYNLGFDYPKQKILDYQQQTFFPYGSKYKGKQSSFAELSWAILCQLKNEI